MELKLNSIRQLSPYLRVAPSRYYYNSGIIISQGKAAIIDPGMADGEVIAIRDFIEAKQAALEAVILTHSHPDHILGPRHFPGVPLYAHTSFVQESARVRSFLVSTFDTWAQEADFDLGVPFSLPIPDLTLSEGAEFTVGDITAGVRYFPGHAPDLIALYHQESRLLWASDMLSDGVIPIVQHSLSDYLQTLARLAEMEIEIQIPGHGEPANNGAEVKKRLDEDRAYLAELHQRIELAVQTGKSLDETLAACESMNFKGRDWNQGGHNRNVQWAWKEFKNLPVSVTDLQ
jgi:glyoxylase-like metal-dependent hydrolase (beta-lactamase superfamily II)